MYRETAEKLLEFIKKSPTAFQAVETMKTRFSEEGFTELREEDHWKIKAGGNYFVTRNNSALIAFSAEACVEVSYYGKPQRFSCL